MKGVGFVAAILATHDSEVSVRKTLELAAEETPPGRNLAVLWPAAHPGERSHPIDALVAASIMGPPDRRTEDKAADDWLLSTPLAVRHYRRDLVLGSTTVGLVFKRQGDAPYTRLRDESQLRQSTIPSRHPAFTRDVANNVWHMPMDRGMDRIVARLASLYSWPDEHILTCSDGKASRRNSLRDLGFSFDLIGVATKQHYEWSDVRVSQGQLGLEIA